MLCLGDTFILGHHFFPGTPGSNLPILILLGTFLLEARVNRNFGFPLDGVSCTSLNDCKTFVWCRVDSIWTSGELLTLFVSVFRFIVTLLNLNKSAYFLVSSIFSPCNFQASCSSHTLSSFFLFFFLAILLLSFTH